MGSWNRYVHCITKDFRTIKWIVQSGSLKISQIMDQFNVKYVMLKMSYNDIHMFLNVNTQDDLNVAEEIIRKNQT